MPEDIRAMTVVSLVLVAIAIGAVVVLIYVMAPVVGA